MQTRKDVMGKVAGLVGDPYFDWLTPEYFSPLCNTAYEDAINYVAGSTSPYIEREVEVPNVSLGSDRSDMRPWGNPPENTDPIDGLITPRLVEYKPVGAPQSQYRECRECSYFPNTPQQVTPASYDFRVTGDFKPPPLLKDDDRVLIHPNGASALAYSIVALIGSEKGNQAWIDTYGPKAMASWDEIVAILVRQQQHLRFGLGSPNRQGRRGFAWNLQGSVGWQWQSYVLYVKLI